MGVPLVKKLCKQVNSCPFAQTGGFVPAARRLNSPRWFACCRASQEVRA